MGGYKQYLRITIRVLSVEAGVCEETVRRHIKQGRLDPWQLKSIHQWLKDVKKEEEEKDDTRR